MEMSENCFDMFNLGLFFIFELVVNFLCFLCVLLFERCLTTLLTDLRTLLVTMKTLRDIFFIAVTCFLVH